jgi:chromosome segregation and condensation protein ScpB
VDIAELLRGQADNLNLRAAVMACFCGQESRRWTVGEIVERFKNLGLSVSKAGVSAALAELALELELAAWAPWQLVERGTEWMLTPKSELLELLGRVRKLPFEKNALSEEHKAVLLVVLGYRRKGGVSKTRIEEILKLDPETYLEDLRHQKLIYADPAREIKFWRPMQSALLALGFSSYTEIPVLKELEQWFVAIESGRRNLTDLDPYFTRAAKLEARRQARESERRRSVRPSSELSPENERVLCSESDADLLRGNVQPAPLPHPDQEPPESVVESRAA